ncbi:MAG: DNA-binding domain-containing protein [Paracoccaceae bacterium]
MPGQPELSHEIVEARFHAALWAPQTPDFVASGDNRDRRFAVYRNNVQHGLSKALAARFPVVERVVGSEFFAAMARVFVAQFPPTDPVLLNWGAAFVPFLAAFEPVRGLPYLPDVARLEWLRGRAYHARDAAPADLSALLGPDAGDLRLRLAPSVHLFESAWPAVSIWQINQPGTAPRALPRQGEQALVARRPDFEVVVEPLDPAQAHVLRHLIAGDPLGVAAADTDPTPILSCLVQHHLISQIEG